MGFSKKNKIDGKISIFCEISIESLHPTNGQIKDGWRQADAIVQQKCKLIYISVHGALLCVYYHIIPLHYFNVYVHITIYNGIPDYETVYKSFDTNER